MKVVCKGMTLKVIKSVTIFETTFAVSPGANKYIDFGNLVIAQGTKIKISVKSDNVIGGATSTVWLARNRSDVECNSFEIARDTTDNQSKEMTLDRDCWMLRYYQHGGNTANVTIKITAETDDSFPIRRDYSKSFNYVQTINTVTNELTDAFPIGQKINVSIKSDKALGQSTCVCWLANNNSASPTTIDRKDLGNADLSTTQSFNITLTEVSKYFGLYVNSGYGDANMTITISSVD